MAKIIQIAQTDISQSIKILGMVKLIIIYQRIELFIDLFRSYSALFKGQATCD